MANTVIHTSESRGDANHGWLQSKHTFSFANYHNPERMHFGVLRVLNDDFVEAGLCSHLPREASRSHLLTCQLANFLICNSSINPLRG